MREINLKLNRTAKNTLIRIGLSIGVIPMMAILSVLLFFSPIIFIYCGNQIFEQIINLVNWYARMFDRIDSKQ